MERGSRLVRAMIDRLGLITAALFLAGSVMSCSGEPGGGERLARAKEAISRGDYPAALIDLKTLAAGNPDDGEVRLLLAETHLELDDGASAEKELARAGQLGIAPATLALPTARAYLAQDRFQEVVTMVQSPDALPAEQGAGLLAVMGNAFLRLGNAEAAKTSFERAQQRVPGHPGAMTGEAALALAQGQPAQARAILDRVLEQSPKYAPALRLLATIGQQSGDYGGALRAYSTLIESKAGKRQDLVSRALVYLALQRIDAAGQDIAAATSGGRSFPYADYASGWIALYERRYQDAAASFRAVLDWNERYTPAALYLAISHYYADGLEQAEALLNGYLAWNPDSLVANTYLGALLAKKGDYQEAQAVFAKPVTTTDPQDIDLLRLLQQEQGQAPEVAQRLRELLATGVRSTGDPGMQRISLVAASPDATQTPPPLGATDDPRQFEADRQRLLTYLAQKQYRDAADFAEKLQEQWPDRPDPINLKAAAELGLGQTDAARRTLEDGLKSFPGNPELTDNLARLLLRDRDVDRARALYRDAMAQNPQDVATVMRLARLELGLGRVEESKALVEQALELAPDSVDVRSTLATYYLTKGQPAVAKRILDEIQGVGQDDPVMLEAQGKVALAMGEVQAAKATLSRLVQLQAQSAEAHYLLAQASAQLGEGDAAVQNLREALRIDPGHYGAQIVLARMYASNGAYDQAEAVLKRMRERFPQSADVFSAQGLLDLRQGDAKSAHESFQRALELRPTSQDLIYDATSLFQLNEIDNGLASLRTWLRDHPDDLQVQLFLANTLLLRGKNDEAEAAFREVIRISPDHELGLNNLAWLLRDRAPQEALAFAERAAALYPKSAQVLDTLGTLKLNAGDPLKAAELLSQAALIEPANPVIQYHYAQALLGSNKPSEAKAVLTKLLDRQDLADDLKAAADAALASIRQD